MPIRMPSYGYDGYYVDLNEYQYYFREVFAGVTKTLLQPFAIRELFQRRLQHSRGDPRSDSGTPVVELTSRGEPKTDERDGLVSGALVCAFSTKLYASC